jgi:pimeloyl-ACP methyl ester carboxylesterase
MGRPGDGMFGKVSWRGRLEFLRRGPRDFDGAVEHLVKTFRRIGSEGRTVDDDEDVRIAVRRSATRERGDGAGGGRQFAAVIAEKDRTEGLFGLDMPALVIHGLRDRIVTPSGGRATAAAIPGAELLRDPEDGPRPCTLDLARSDRRNRANCKAGLARRRAIGSGGKTLGEPCGHGAPADHYAAPLTRLRDSSRYPAAGDLPSPSLPQP